MTEMRAAVATLPVSVLAAVSVVLLTELCASEALAET